MAVVWWVVVKCLIVVFSFSVCALEGMMGKIVDLKYDTVWNVENIKKGTSVTRCLGELLVKEKRKMIQQDYYLQWADMNTNKKQLRNSAHFHHSTCWHLEWHILPMFKAIKLWLGPCKQTKTYYHRIVNYDSMR